MVSPPTLKPALMLEAVKRFSVTAWVQPPFSPPGWNPAAAYCSLRYRTTMSSAGVPMPRPWKLSSDSTRACSDRRAASKAAAGPGASGPVLAQAEIRAPAASAAAVDRRRMDGNTLSRKSDPAGR